MGEGRSNSPQRLFDEAIGTDFDSSDISVCLASARGRAAEPDFQNLEMTRELAHDFRNILKRFCNQQREDGKTVYEYSMDESPSEHSVQFVNLADYPEAQAKVANLDSPAGFVTFANEPRFTKHLRFYAIVAQTDNQQPVIGLRALTPAQKPDRGKWSLGALYNEAIGRYARLQDDLFLFDDEIDCLLYGSVVFIANRSKFEQIFNFEQVSYEVAERALSLLRDNTRIRNFEQFEKSCLADRRKHRKLAAIARSADLSEFTVAKAREVIAVNPGLSSIISTDAGDEVLTYDPARSWDLLRFLSETTGRSVVTGRGFEALGDQRFL